MTFGQSLIHSSKAMANEDIEKLKKKVEKDPLSKLSVPLAEEYKKRGMLDNAINVLLKAIENRPDYTSARVALGKIYLDKNMLSEARNEFEKVINLIPDNLLAHKKLADIYHQQGEIDKAFEEYQTILKLNPNDEEAKAVILSLSPPEELADDTQSQAELAPTGQADDPGDSSDIAEQDSVESHPENMKKIPEYEIQEEVNGAELGIELPEKLTPVVEESESKELERFRKTMEVESEKSSTSETIQAQPDDTDLSDISLSDSEENLEESNGEAVQTPRDQSQEDKIVISMPTETMADIFITQEQYDKAMDIYNEILSADPENKRIIQRREELKMLIKLKDEKYRGDR